MRKGSPIGSFSHVTCHVLCMQQCRQYWSHGPWLFICIIYMPALLLFWVWFDRRIGLLPTLCASSARLSLLVSDVGIIILWHCPNEWAIYPPLVSALLHHSHTLVLIMLARFRYGGCEAVPLAFRKKCGSRFSFSWLSFHAYNASVNFLYFTHTLKF